jgi:hypothetical protein
VETSWLFLRHHIKHSWTINRMINWFSCLSQAEVLWTSKEVFTSEYEIWYCQNMQAMVISWNFNFDKLDFASVYNSSWSYCLILLSQVWVIYIRFCLIFRVQGMASVLNALGGPKKGGAIPYRDSVITRVLQVRLKWCIRTQF